MFKNIIILFVFLLNIDAIYAQQIQNIFHICNYNSEKNILTDSEKSLLNIEECTDTFSHDSNLNIIDILVIKYSNIKYDNIDLISELEKNLFNENMNVQLNVIDSILIDGYEPTNTTQEILNQRINLIKNKIKLLKPDVVVTLLPKDDKINTNEGTRTDGFADIQNIFSESTEYFYSVFSNQIEDVFMHEFGHVFGLNHDKNTLEKEEEEKEEEKEKPKSGIHSKGYIFKETNNGMGAVSLMGYSQKIEGLEYIRNNSFTNIRKECTSTPLTTIKHPICGADFTTQVIDFNNISDNYRVLVKGIPQIASFKTRDNKNDPLFLDSIGIQSDKFLLGTDLDDNITLSGNQNIIVTSSGKDKIGFSSGEDYIFIQPNGVINTTINNFTSNDYLVFEDSSNKNISYGENSININFDENSNVTLNTDLVNNGSFENQNDKENVSKCEKSEISKTSASIPDNILLKLKQISGNDIFKMEI